jgi:hypothetical protein
MIVRGELVSVITLLWKSPATATAAVITKKPINGGRSLFIDFAAAIRPTFR